MTVFSSDLPGLGQFTLVRLDPDKHLDFVYEWVREPRAEFWGMNGCSRRKVRKIYRFVDSLETHHAYLMKLDGSPVGIFQTYEPAHDPIASSYPVRDGDFGIHLLLAPATTPIPGFTGAVLDALWRFVFAVPSRKRIVIEPDVRNDRGLRRWKRAGFVLGDQVELPHKTAQLAFLDRSATSSS